MQGWSRELVEELDPSADPEAFKTMQVRTHERTSWFPGKHTKFPFVRVFPWETHEIPREIPWELISLGISAAIRSIFHCVVTADAR